MTPRFDRARPESPEVQARIQAAAQAKRARRAQAYRRAQELTALGRVVSRMWAAHPKWEYLGYTIHRGDTLTRHFQPSASVRDALVALHARRGQP